MSNGDLNWIANFIWGIADDILRDLYVRGKYQDVILPLTVLRRLDCVLAPTKEKVLGKQAELRGRRLENLDPQLRKVSGFAFYNTSRYDFEKLLADFKDRDTSKIFPTTHFGFRQITVERPLRLNFQASPERIARLEDEKGFQYTPPRHLEEIEADIRVIEQDIMRMLAEVTGNGQGGVCND